MFYTMELVADHDTKTPLRKTTEKYTRTIIKDISDFLFREKNVYVPSDKFGIWVVPPLIVTESEMDWFCEAIDEALDLVDKTLSAGK